MSWAFQPLTPAAAQLLSAVADPPFKPVDQPNPTLRRQGGMVQVAQTLLLTTLAVVPTVDTVFREPLVTRIVARQVQQPEVFPNLVARHLGTVTFSGSGAVNLPLLTASGTGTKARAGTGAPTLPLLTASGTGTKARAGTGSPTLPLITAAGTGTKARSGSGAATLPLLTASGAGTKARAGTGSPTLPLLTASGSGSSSSSHSGSGAPSLPLLTASGTGTKARAGTGTPSLPLLTAAGAGTKSRSGSGAPSLPLLTASGSGSSGALAVPFRPVDLTPRWTVPRAQQPTHFRPAPDAVPRHVGSGSPSLPLLTASGAGTGGTASVRPFAQTDWWTPARTSELHPSQDWINVLFRPAPPFAQSDWPNPVRRLFKQQPELLGNVLEVVAGTNSGSGSPSLPLLTAAGTGTKARAGTGATTLPLLTASGTGTKARSGTGTATLPLLTASGAGTKARAGTGAATLPLLTADGAGFSTTPGVHSGSGAPVLPLLTASGVGTSTSAAQQATGGWGAYNAYEVERQRKRRLRELELEDEADRLEALLIAEQKLPPNPVIDDRITVREYAVQAEGFNRRAQRAIDYALRARTDLAYQLAAREIANQLEDEEYAILLLLASL